MPLNNDPHKQAALAAAFSEIEWTLFEHWHGAEKTAEARRYEAELIADEQALEASKLQAKAA